MVWLGLGLVVIMVLIFITAAEKVKYGEFQHQSWWLLTFGIYMWGQALILAGFWIIFGLLCIFRFTPLMAMKGYILFHVIRGLTELALVKSTDYQGLSGLFLPDTKTVSANDRIQLYSLTQAVIIISGLLFLFL